MAKSTKKKGPKENRSIKTVDSAALPSATLDPHLIQLFNSSTGRAPVASKPSNGSSKGLKRANISLPQDQASDSDGSSKVSIISEASVTSTSPAPEELPQRSRKRKRRAQEDDLEDRYMKRLAAEESVHDAANEPSPEAGENGEQHVESQGTQTDDDGAAAEVESDEDGSATPVHETLTQTKQSEDIEKASRTVFLGNVSISAIQSKASRRALMDHLSSFLPDLPESKTHKVESLRFRSTAFADAALPKKAAYVKKDLLEATTRSTNAYAVYSTQLAARGAVKRLNATIVLDRHLRVDGVAHPSRIDHRRCVFVGNLGFVDDESNIKAIEEEVGRGQSQKRNKSKAPADVEEGLWRQFEKAGAVESVRVVRDKTTRVGKGFAYVQFENPNAVEKALLFNDKKYPPLLPRKLRVTRAKSMTKTASNLSKGKALRAPTSTSGYRAKPSAEVQSLAGRASKLFGRAGAHGFFQRVKEGDTYQPRQRKQGFKAPEDFVFEGHRAKQGQASSKLSKSKKGSKRTKRSTAFRSRMRKR